MFNLLFMPTCSALAHLMRRLLAGYVVTFNHRHNRVSHLFQNGYKLATRFDERILAGSEEKAFTTKTLRRQ